MAIPIAGLQQKLNNLSFLFQFISYTHEKGKEKSFVISNLQERLIEIKTELT